MPKSVLQYRFINYYALNEMKAVKDGRIHTVFSCMNQRHTLSVSIAHV